MDEEQLELFGSPALDREDRVLILARDELFEGSWELLEQAFRDRLNKQPVNPKTFLRIEADLARIEKMKRRGY